MAMILFHQRQQAFVLAGKVFGEGSVGSLAWCTEELASKCALSSMEVGQKA